jgi:hypothetical protein
MGKGQSKTGKQTNAAKRIEDLAAMGSFNRSTPTKVWKNMSIQVPQLGVAPEPKARRTVTRRRPQRKAIDYAPTPPPVEVEMTVKELPGGVTYKSRVIVTPQLKFSRKQAENIEKADPGEKNMARIALKTLSELANDTTVIEWFSRLHWGLGLKRTATPQEQERAIELAARNERLTRVTWKILRRIGVAEIILALASQELIPDEPDPDGIAPLFKALRNAAYRERWKTVTIELGLRGWKFERDLDTIAETDVIRPTSHEAAVQRLIEIGRERGLSADQITILIAKLEGFERNELPAVLGWEPKRVCAVWRSVAEDRWGADLKAGLIRAMAEPYGGSRSIEALLKIKVK